MSKTINQRMTVHLDGDFVVFLIGMRINRWWKLHKWLPVANAMPKMLKELSQKPDSGFLGAETSLGLVIQYWKSFEHWKPMPRTVAACIIRPGKPLIQRLRAMVMWVSGMKPIKYGQANTNVSITTCPLMALEKLASWYPLLGNGNMLLTVSPEHRFCLI
jgi:hypothetical protein